MFVYHPDVYNWRWLAFTSNIRQFKIVLRCHLGFAGKYLVKKGLCAFILGGDWEMKTKNFCVGRRTIIMAKNSFLIWDGRRTRCRRRRRRHCRQHPIRYGAYGAAWQPHSKQTITQSFQKLDGNENGFSKQQIKVGVDFLHWRRSFLSNQEGTRLSCGLLYPEILEYIGLVASGIETFNSSGPDLCEKASRRDQRQTL